MTESLEDRIIRHEGFTATPKFDAKDMYVIGIGHDITEDQAQTLVNGITYDEAIDWLHEDIDNASNALVKTFPWMLSVLTPTRLDVVTEMIFQMGVHGLMGFHDMLYNMRQGNNEGVAREMLNSAWHKQTPARAEELANLYLTNGENHD